MKSIENVFVILVLILGAANFFACSRQADGGTVRLEDRAAAADVPFNQWSDVYEQVMCGPDSPRPCLGARGFAIRSDGTFAQGSDEGSIPVTGTISDEELGELSSAAQEVARGNLHDDVQCGGTSGLAPGSRLQLKLILMNRDSYGVYDEDPGRGVCVHGNAEAVARLHRVMHKLLIKYYLAN